MSWSGLPADLVSEIADRITEHADLARFRSVCPSWRSASAAHAARRRVPLLLVPSQISSVNRGLWSLADDRIVEIPVPAASGFFFLFASPRGWTLGVAHDGASAKLLHPITGASEGLPKLPPPFFRDGDRKILRDMVWDRSPDAIMISPGKGAFFCRLPPSGGGGSWSPVAGCSLQDAGRVSSITYCDGTFYLLDGSTRRVMAVDGTTFAVAAVIEPPDMVLPARFWLEPNSVLVASSGELLLIVRTSLLLEVVYHSSEGFLKIFRAGVRGPAAAWSEVTDGSGIGDRAVFVDHFRGFCVEASGVNGLRRNCMYVARGYEVVDDDYGMDVYAKFTVSVLDLADLTTDNLEYGNLSKFRDGSLWRWPSWLMH
ncbi:hypothetical protein QYE76_014340 [Lolium multiflorum]|uniref:F-box domain-containing protein n=1 Tax=Lolium multiflorum TaxID=4521 RepID=A0AAD8U4C3_LOLMU|nr:hypothetical protein QYE76_014340 [Lolium multiflorum]